MGFLSDVDACVLFLVDIVDEGYGGFIIFCGVIWPTLGEDSVFELSDVADTWFLCGFGVSVSMPSPDLSGTVPYLLLHLVFSPHDDVLDLDAFFVIILRLLLSCSL